MTVRLPDLVGRLRLDTRDLDRAKGEVNAFSRGIGSTFGDLDRSLTQVQKSMGRVGDGLSDVGKRASIGATLPIAAGFGLATKAASDLSEQVNKARVVFGDAADGVLAFSEDAAKGLGQSQRAALEAAGTYGNLFAAIDIGNQKSAEMSKRLLTLGADLASFNNANPEDVFLALRAGLVGETEPLRKFGVNLTDARLRAEALNLGLSDGKSVLDANAKAQAAYSLILKDTAVAQGDFERTSGGLANQSRILRAELEDTTAEMGSNLIPVALKLTSVASGLLETFSDMPGAAQNLSLIGLAGIAAVGPISFLAGNALKLQAALTAATAAAAAQSFGAGVAAASTVRLAGAVGKVGLAGAGLFGVVQVLQAIGGEAGKTTVDMEKLAAASNEVLAARFRDLLAFDKGTAGEAFGAVLENSVTEAQRVVDALKAAGVATGDWQARVDAAVASEARAVVAREKDADVTERAADVTERAADAMRGATAATEADTAALGPNTTATGANAASREDAAAAAKAYAEAVEGILDATVEAADAEVAQERAVASFADALADVADKERDLADARRDRTSAARDAISEERALNSVEDARSSLVDAERALADARRGRGQQARELADAEKALADAQEEAAGARGVRALADANERVAEAQERVNEAREGGGREADVADATERVSRARLDARDAELSLSEQREERAERERQSAQAVKAAEAALAAAHLNAQTAALQSAAAQRDLAAAQAEADGKPLDAAAQYRIYRDALIGVKDTVGPGSDLHRGLIGIIDSLPPPETKFAIVADTAQPNAALEGIRQGFLRLRDEVNVQGPTLFGPVGGSADEAMVKVRGINTAAAGLRTIPAPPFRFEADVEPLNTALAGVREQIDSMRADTANLLASLTVPRIPTLAATGAAAIRPGVASIADASTRSPVTNNVTVNALGANADVAREIDYRTARAAARAR